MGGEFCEMEPLFKGYVLTKDKQCLENFKGVKRLKTLDDVRDADEFAAILGEDTILIDVDDGPTSDLLFSMVQDLGLKCRVYATTRGNTSISATRKELWKKLDETNPCRWH